MSYKHILVAVDLSEASQVVINKAIAQAKDSNCKLSFVYVDVDSVVLEHEVEQKLSQRLQLLADQADYPVSDCQIVIGDLHMKLSGLVKEQEIDLVVCGHHHSLLSRIFSSIPKVANAVEADLLIVYLAD
ncbi:universal stress protein [Vibrio mytili]|uniref:Universal stress protein n=1 Tax=Vibrio mytili TaxID=50718 RepID=A0A0C3ICG2_9VIBR|nr:universal stress protein [Vibrio mytili]KIN12012.1 universal stress protein [Vibrio mytili]